MDDLGRIVKEAVFWYAAAGSGVKTFPMTSEHGDAYGVVIVDHPAHKNPAGIVVMARIVGDMVVIEEDTSDRPLIDALVERGIPRENIIRAYLGEPLPEARAVPEAG